MRMAKPSGIFHHEHARYWIVLAVLSVSTAAILIKLSNAHPLAIAFWRLLFAWAILLPFSIGHLVKNKERPSRTDVLIMVAVGFVLAVHFTAWIWSFQTTKVSSSVLLVTTHPVFVAAISVYVFKERMNKLAFVGIGIGLLGAAILVFADLNISGDTIVGDSLALLGSLMAGIYLLAGSRLRSRVSLGTYVNIVYGSAMLFLLGGVLILGIDPVQTDPVEYLIFAGMAIGPMILGHTLYNWALKYVSPTLVSVSLLGEPLGSTVLAMIILAEFPWIGFYIGAPLILAGIYLVSLKPAGGKE
jgi:drug/metabolite transporter (DMT)-like permease